MKYWWIITESFIINLSNHRLSYMYRIVSTSLSICMHHKTHLLNYCTLIKHDTFVNTVQAQKAAIWIATTWFNTILQLQQSFNLLYLYIIPLSDCSNCSLLCNVAIVKTGSSIPSSVTLLTYYPWCIFLPLIIFLAALPQPSMTSATAISKNIMKDKIL